MIASRRMVRVLIMSIILSITCVGLWQFKSRSALSIDDLKQRGPHIADWRQKAEGKVDLPAKKAELPAKKAELLAEKADLPAEKADFLTEKGHSALDDVLNENLVLDSPPVAEPKAERPKVETPKVKQPGAIPRKKEPVKDASSPDNMFTDEDSPFTDAERNAFLANYLVKMVRQSPPATLEPLKAKPGLPDEFTSLSDMSRAVTAKNLAKYLSASKEHMQTLKKYHDSIVFTVPNTPKQFYKPGRGIVLTGGGTYMAPMLSAVVWTRRCGIEEPIEVFMSKKEYFPELCDVVLPSYNAECRLVEDIYGQESLSNFKYMGYPLKLLALLASRYEEAYAMDADSLPISKVSALFDEEAYKLHEYVLWPDFWPRSTVPEFYELVGKQIKLPEGADPDTTPVSSYIDAIPESQSSESGQMLVNKTKHFKSLLLNLYYNMNGFEQYYPLLTSGAPGEGDKDCFAASAYVLGEKLYQIKTTPRAVGFRNEKDEFQGRAIVQVDPQADYERSKLRSDAVDGEKRLPAAVFHANGVKLNPIKLYCDDAKNCTVFPTTRIFGPTYDTKDNLALANSFDIELEFFTSLNVVTCKHLASAPSAYKPFEGYDLKTLCETSTKHIQWLVDNP